jgi:hypothetical protein
MGTLIALAILVAASAWVYSDAKTRGKGDGEALIWSILTFALLIVFLPLWLIMRPVTPGEVVSPTLAVPQGGVKLCARCGKYYDGDPSFCPNCGESLQAQA